MIDLHCHILYDIDDGSPSLEISLEMARTAVADGITVVAATPHSPESGAGKRYTVAAVQERLAALRAALVREAIPLTIVAGTEITVASDIVSRLRSGALLTYEGSHTILLECPGAHMPEMLPEVIFGLQTAGYRVVLAHPERLREVQHDPYVLAPLIERGALMQVTGAALLGQQGDVLAQTAQTMLQRSLLHVIASDAHGILPRRPLLLAAAHARAIQLVGQATADALVRDTPDALLHDRPLRLPPPQPAPKKRWLW